MPRSIDIHTVDEAADHAPTTWSTRVALSHAARSELPLGSHSISGPTARNLSDRVSKNRKRCGAAQGAAVTNHRQHTGCASAAHSPDHQDHARQQPDPVTQDPETQPQRREPPPPEQRRRRRLNSPSPISLHIFCASTTTVVTLLQSRRPFHCAAL
jgi:hypothetical protein